MIRAFLSFVEEDLNVVNLFRGQAKNNNSDLELSLLISLSRNHLIAPMLTT